MDKIVIRGGKRLEGVVPVSGSKNAALPILISSLLTDKTCQFSRVPALQDIRTTFKVLASMGVKVTEDWSGNSCVLKADQITVKEAPYDLVRTMRASVLVLGPILARFGTARVSLPGGCAIGARPIDFHLSALEKMGAEIKLEEGYVVGRAKRLHGARIHFEFPSVGATENLMMAACLAKGETILENCAKEPEIVDLACSLRAMGAEISGEGTETIQIQGKEDLGACQYAIMGDRIEAGTFLAAGFATLGKVRVSGIKPEYLEAVLAKFEDAGAEIKRGSDFIEINAKVRPKGVDFSTLPFPGFPTDMQAQLMAVLTLSSGTSVITETIFENRFMHVPELARLGADIRVNGNTAIVRGVEKLNSAPLMATDLRASASLMIGGLAAQGETTIHRVYHLDRGYEKIEEKLRALGADIERKN